MIRVVWQQDLTFSEENYSTKNVSPPREMYLYKGILQLQILPTLPVEMMPIAKYSASSKSAINSNPSPDHFPIDKNILVLFPNVHLIHSMGYSGVMFVVPIMVLNYSFLIQSTYALLMRIFISLTQTNCVIFLLTNIALYSFFSL